VSRHKKIERVRELERRRHRRAKRIKLRAKQAAGNTGTQTKA
jgi:hypothetical protein